METRYERHHIKKGIVSLLGTALLIGSCIKYTLPKSYLRTEDFDNAAWVKIDNRSAQGIWGYYMKEDIAHTALNWQAYIREVKKKNDGILEGNIVLPDLDGDNKVSE